MKLYAKILAVVLVLLMTVSLVGCGQSGTIKIGAIMPITGQVSLYGTQSQKAMQMYVDELNAKGGINGQKVTLIVEDDEATPEKSVNAFKKLTAQDKVVAFVGALTSKCSNAITSEAQAKKIVMLSSSSTADEVTDAGDFVFRACYNDSFQGVVVSQFAFETVGAKKAAILFDNANDYSKGLTETFKANFLALGGEIVAEESYNTGDKDFAAQITKIKGTSPDVIFIPDYYSTVSVIAKQVREQGITVPMMGADGWDGVTAEAGDEVIDCYFSNHYAADSDDADVKRFVAAYKAKYNEDPNALAALAYDSIVILTDAIAKAGSMDSQKIRDALAATDKKVVTGQIKFNEKRNPVKSAVMVKIVKGADGKLTTQYAGTVNP